MKRYLCSKSLRISEDAPTRQSVSCSHLLVHSVWISFAIISFTLVTSTLKRQSLTRFDDFKVSTRDALSVLQRTSGNLGSLNISWCMVAINTSTSAAPLNTTVSEANGVLVTLSSFFDDQHIGAIFFLLPQPRW